MSKECSSCRAENIDSATECSICGAILENKEFPVTQKPSSAVLTMTDLSSKKVIKITDSCIIGRSGNVETEFFAKDLYISEYHCRVIFENNEYKIEHLPTATNHTKINKDFLGKGIRRIIRSGDYLKIADKTFEISIFADEICLDACNGTTVPEAFGTENSNASGVGTVIGDSAEQARYVITCPQCGTEYEVNNINDKINECNNCDEYDKHEISKIGAKVKYAN